jgi:hypothetical protein
LAQKKTAFLIEETCLQGLHEVQQSEGQSFNPHDEGQGFLIYKEHWEPMKRKVNNGSFMERNNPIICGKCLDD